jgi:hypothetical protein
MYHTGHQSRARLTPFRLSTRSYIHLPETKTSTITPRIGRLTSSQNGVRQFSLTSKHTTFQNYRFLLRVIPDADHADQLICELDAMAWVAEGQVHTMSFTLWQLRMSSLMKEPSPIIHGDVSDGYRQDEKRDVVIYVPHGLIQVLMTEEHWAQGQSVQEQTFYPISITVFPVTPSDRCSPE